MMQKSLLLAALIPGSLAFSSTNAKASLLQRRSASSLNVGVTWEEYDAAAYNDFMMNRAQTCANSELCSLEEAQFCLDEIRKYSL